MPQTTSVGIISRDEKSCSDHSVSSLLEFLGAPIKYANLWDRRRDRILRELLPDEFRSSVALAASGKWVLLRLSGLPCRIGRFLDDYRAENVPSLLPSRFYGETSIHVGQHRIEGQIVSGKEGKPFDSWLSVSFYCEETPTDWKGFEEEFRNARATTALLDDLRRIAPDFELSIRYFT